MEDAGVLGTAQAGADDDALGERVGGAAHAVLDRGGAVGLGLHVLGQLVDDRLVRHGSAGDEQGEEHDLHEDEAAEAQGREAHRLLAWCGQGERHGQTSVGGAGRAM